MEDLYRLNSDRQIKQFWDELVESSSTGGQHQSFSKERKINLQILRKNKTEKQSCRTREGSKISEKMLKK